MTAEAAGPLRPGLRRSRKHIIFHGTTCRDLLAGGWYMLRIYD